MDTFVVLLFLLIHYLYLSLIFRKDLIDFYFLKKVLKLLWLLEIVSC